MTLGARSAPKRRQSLGAQAGRTPVSVSDAVVPQLDFGGVVLSPVACDVGEHDATYPFKRQVEE